MTPQAVATGVCITPTYGAMQAGMSLMNTPNVVVNGVKYLAKWREPLFFPLPPGRHHVEVSYNWLSDRTCPGALDVDVAPGQVVYVTYRPPMFIFMKGRVAIEAGPPANAKRPGT